MAWFWIVAGPNSAGKTTLVECGVIQIAAGLKLVTLNADVRTRKLLVTDPRAADANLCAAIEIDAGVVACIDTGVDFLVETVLSTDKYLDDIRRAISLGYRIGVIYVGLATPDDAVRRVALRQRRGGHGVPKDKIRARCARLIAMLGRIAPLAHRLYIYDNTSTFGPVMIARKAGARLEWLAPGRIPEIDAVVAGPGPDPA